MDGRNGGAMGKSNRGKAKDEKKGRVVTMPEKGGGKSAAEGAKVKKKAAAKKPTGGPKNNNAKAMKPKTRGKKAEKEIEKEDYKGAKKKLRHWVKKEVKEHSPEIAGSLVKNTEEGDTQSAAMVLALMEKKKKSEDDDGLDGPSLAEELTAGPTWEDVLEARRKAREEEEGETEAA